MFSEKTKSYSEIFSGVSGEAHPSDACSNSVACD